jgi:hypothetical protein
MKAIKLVSRLVITCAFLASVQLNPAARGTTDEEFDCSGDRILQTLRCTEINIDPEVGPLTCGDIGDEGCAELCSDAGWTGGVMPESGCSDGPPVAFDCVCGLHNR